MYFANVQWFIPKHRFEAICALPRRKDTKDFFGTLQSLKMDEVIDNVDISEEVWTTDFINFPCFQASCANL